MNKKKIVYILGLGHSGSTLIEYYLSSYKNCIGIGEAFKASFAFQEGNLDKFSEYDLERIEKVPLWNKMAKSAKEHENAEKQYLAIYDYILHSDEFSKYDLIIDSSKKLAGYKILSEHYGDQVYAIILYKDVRSWVISSIDTMKRKNRKVGLKTKYKLTTKWMRDYYLINRYLNNNNKQHFKISYDLFCLDYENVKNLFKKKLELNSEPDFLNTNSINLIGNRMKKKADIKLEIKYDYRWASRREWLLPWLLYPGLKTMNKNNVWRY
ncbi:MAG: hypothetical protein JJU28_19580 [Cyclobacteriaceae bacterium]|nr:hypothetical protein [Cyclobacteriaceae bacterium]